jgi:hypothetical protein
MTDRELPELPSDEELGIAGLDEEELLRGLDDTSGEGVSEKEGGGAPPSAGEPPPPAPPSAGPGGGRPLQWWLPFAVLVVLLTGSWASSSQRSLPAPAPANAPDSTFSSARAMSQLVEIARAPRPVGAPEHTRVREYLLDRLGEMGLEPQVHGSLHQTRAGQSVRAVTVRNVLARIPGRASTGAILVTAHYDAVPVSPGAGDDGVGVVAILETARALLAGPPLDNDVILLLTDAEEVGLLGARSFVAEHPWMDDVSVVLSVEMRGAGGPSIMFETGADNGWIIEAMKAGDPRPMAPSLAVEVYRRLPNDTDFTPFREAGIQGLNFAGIHDAWVYHQATDVPANVSEATIQHHGMRVLGIIRELGARDLSEVRAPDRIHFVLPVVGLVHFPVSWMLPLALACFVLWLAVIALTLVRGAGVAGLLTGFGLAVVAMVLAAAVGWGLMRWLPAFHPEFQTMTPAFHGEGWYVLALVAMGLAVVVGLLGLARRRFALSGLAAGALAVPVVGGAAAAALAPLAAVILVGPATAGVAATALGALAGAPGERSDPVQGRGPSRGPSVAVWVGSLLLALPVLAFLVPIIELLWVAMSFRLAAVLGVLMVIALLAMVPALDALAGSGRGWAPVAVGLGGLVVAGGLVGCGLLLGGPSEDRPLPSTLIYVMDREGAVVGDDEDASEAQVAASLWVTVPGPGLSWAEDQVENPFREDVPLARFSLPDGLLASEARPQSVAAPEVILVEWREPEFEDGLARARLALRSVIGAEVVVVGVPEDGPARLTALNRQPLAAAPAGSPGAGRPVTRLRHQGVPEPDLVLDFEVASGAQELRLVVLEEHFRASELVGPEHFRRPPGLMPASGYHGRTGPSDRAILRTPVVLPLIEAPSEPEEPADLPLPADPIAHP